MSVLAAVITACGREWDVHPAAQVFPLIEGEPFAKLVADIREHGQREAITLHPDGSLLDGRNRLRACEMAGVEPTTRVWNGDGSAVAYVVSLNLHRRHLDESQRAMVAAKIANLGDGQRADRVAASIEAPTTQRAAAELLNVSRPSVQRAREVVERGTTELVKAVEQGQISVSAAAKATDLSPVEQRAVVARVQTGEKPADVIREVSAGRPPRVPGEVTRKLPVYLSESEYENLRIVSGVFDQSMSEFVRLTAMNEVETFLEGAPEYRPPRSLERRRCGDDQPVELERRRTHRRTT